MRFAWLRQQTGNDAAKGGLLSRLIRTAYNLIWWLPLLLTILGTVDTGTGFVLFVLITVLRAAANVYRNNVLPLEQAEVFPLRA